MFPLYMLPEKDADVRQQVMLHGLFHRIQPELGLITDDGFNEHLDTLEGRVWIQLEWRALRRAVESSGSDQAEAIADALVFRGERRRLFPGAADNERRDEIREGRATYTGVAGTRKEMMAAIFDHLCSCRRRVSRARECRRAGRAC
jgi:hypothetical protein